MNYYINIPKYTLTNCSNQLTKFKMIPILDINGEKLPSINLVEYSIKKPFLINDVLKKKEKIPEIRVYEDLNILKEIQFVIYGKDLEDDEKWAKRQRYSLHLRPGEAPVEKSFKKLLRLPTKHYIEVDINNYKVRVVGDFVDLREKGRWQEY